ncbi:FxsA family protein [Actinoplanes sp. NBRC 101535]|uniref:FxsA family protein n=1 Tax=Actinoplanes sp. NBRC 101535 TaxID=3032196 RepID=UPI0024A35A42|nr:FxsA family protein [Actinoplanes sp. NBRC 101535]GLY02926.1 hypothetical protein Acsp01_33050 [Actinoplanes sp. NBRC 101535]
MRRSRLAYLPLAFPVLALIEIVVFLSVADAIGGFWAVLILAASTLGGLALLRREGIKGWRAFQAAARAGRAPGAEVTHSLIGLLGSLLLAVPGFLTSVAGLLFLLPPGRGLARRGVERFAERRLGGAAAGTIFGPRKVVVVVDDEIVDEPVNETVPRRGPSGAIEGEIVR